MVYSKVPLRVPCIGRLGGLGPNPAVFGTGALPCSPPSILFIYILWIKEGGFRIKAVGGTTQQNQKAPAQNLSQAWQIHFGSRLRRAEAVHRFWWESFLLTDKARMRCTAR